MAKLLIVEDNPDNMKLFRALLTRQGHELIELTSGEGLIEATARHRPDLVVLDIQLPGRDGWALAAELRATFGTSLRIAALTAYAQGSDQTRALESGFDAFITKPIDVRLFPAQIAAALATGPGSAEPA